MLHNTESGRYRIYQSSRFEDYKEFIEPDNVCPTALFIFDNFESSHGKDLSYIAKDVCSSIEVHDVHVITDGVIDVGETVRQLNNVIQFKEQNNIPVVVNCSWHVESNKHLTKKFEECIEKGIHVFCAVDQNHKESFLPGVVEGVHKVGFLDTNFRQKGTGPTDFYVPGGNVKTESGAASGSSVSSVLAAAMMCYLHSYVEENKVETAFKNMINEKRSQLIWPFVVDPNLKLSNTTFNIDTEPTIKGLYVYNKACKLSEIVGENCAYGVDIPELHIDCLCIEPTVDLATGIRFPFKVVAQFEKFSLTSETVYGISEEEVEGYEQAFVHTFVNKKFKSFA